MFLFGGNFILRHTSRSDKATNIPASPSGQPILECFYLTKLNSQSVFSTTIVFTTIRSFAHVVPIHKWNPACTPDGTVFSRLNVHNKPTVVCVIDLQKGFGFVWVNGLIYKLIQTVSKFRLPELRSASSKMGGSVSIFRSLVSNIRSTARVSFRTYLIHFYGTGRIPEIRTDVIQYADNMLILASGLRSNKNANSF